MGAGQPVVSIHVESIIVPLHVPPLHVGVIPIHMREPCAHGFGGNVHAPQFDELAPHGVPTVDRSHNGSGMLSALGTSLQVPPVAHVGVMTVRWRAPPIAQSSG
jgi:hypothetical protein